MKSKKDISQFYDEYVDNQKKMAYNERHICLYKKLKQLGLNHNSSILEIGCGIGVISSLIAKTVTSGKIISLDISPKSIADAKGLGIKNAEFIVSDAAAFSFEKTKFDFITLFDVLEHIPIDQHGEVFHNIAKHMNNETVLFINIPNPLYLEYIIQNRPQLLQIIDQPLPADLIMKNAYNSSLELFFFQTHSVFVENDYQMMLFRKKAPFKEKAVKESITKNFLHRILYR